jgi:molybdenum cofactor synthesis domain-containing protein
MSEASSSAAPRFSAAVLTVSDSSFRGDRPDQSGPAVRDLLAANGFAVAGGEIVPDEKTAIENALIEWCGRADLVVTTGGTGLAERDVTPEAMLRVCERLVPGIPERIRAEGFRRTPFAALSRGLCGVRNATLILNLPGNPKAASDSLAVVLELLPHALELLHGKTEH